MLQRRCGLNLLEGDITRMKCLQSAVYCYTILRLKLEYWWQDFSKNSLAVELINADARLKILLLSIYNAWNA
ncbi:hypothetical protein KIN20_019502 [Parelaphostrongylus tenuis]|uniref:Uncharacterized protein n=1 Tax=Parelaphostrongylus tenuis TaxID=148309 RepID=A0AAD5N8T2_PARTN|nr:hypothetical protein KIN20_019502 [Parelaphostrongylus tenuis]